ncbi:MAG: tripartite tricarboxylate transporter permease [Euryarchaeota archaeon]|jgi:putative membrane protein|nr:tripartite tricarboxylate transporter permease [Euryarchaeota archaeon]HNS25423.1 tripartite tricarboxylate transporter permease [Methanobacteriaceae archaeon]
MVDLILACFIGIFCGAVTGLIPGIHVNTVGAFVFASSTFLLNFHSPETISVFLISMSISHALLEFIPSMFLGVPEEGTVLSILPGHQMLLQGRGKEAIRLVALGGFGSVLVIIALLPMFMMVLPPLYGLLKPYIWIMLIIVVVVMIIRLSRDRLSMFWSSLLFVLSGIMGWTLLNSSLPTSVSFLSMFTGLFGVSTMLYSLSQNSFLPEQNQHHKVTINTPVIRGIFAGGIAGSILGFLPGLGPAQGSMIAQELSGGSDAENQREGFLVAMSGVNVSDALFSLMAIYLIGNPRSGIAVYVNHLLNGVNFAQLLVFIFTSVTAVSVALILCLKLGDAAGENLEKFDYQKLTWSVIIFMSFLVGLFSFIEQANILMVVLTYITSISLGLLPHYLGINKSHLMGVLIVPAIVVYMGL